MKNSIVAFLALSLSSVALVAAPAQAAGIKAEAKQAPESRPASPPGVYRGNGIRLMLVSDPPPIGNPGGNRFHRIPETSLSRPGSSCTHIGTEYTTSMMPFSLIRRRCAIALYRCVVTVNHMLVQGISYTLRVNLGCTFG